MGHFGLCAKQDALSFASQARSDVVFAFTNGGTLTLLGLQLQDLTGSNFSFLRRMT